MSTGTRPNPTAARIAWAAMLLVILAMLGFTARADAAFLEPDQAFRFSARTVDANTIEVKYGIADGYYLYRERFKFALDPAASGGATLGEPVFPKGEIKFDETFQKDVEHYRNEVVVRMPVSGATGPFTLLSTSQGCADAGLCYPPQVAKATLTIAGAPGGDPPRASLDDSSRIQSVLMGGNFGWIALLFFGLGVLLAFTPCVLPMVPILSSIIVGRAGRRDPLTRGAGLMLAVAYSLGMALVYTLLGVAAGLAGEGLAATLQTPWVLGAFAALLVVLSLSMFGLYELQVPVRLQTRMAQWSGKLGASAERPGTGSSTGRFAGVFAMGALSALIVGPCVAAPLAGTLLYISQTRNVVIGGVALFALAVGMCMPLLLIGLSAGSLLPRVGAWMITVKHFFGVLLIAVALWMVSPVLPTWIAMLAWATIAIVAAVFLRVFDTLGPDARGIARIGKGVGVLLLLAGAVEFVGLATGGRDVLQPLGHLAQRGGAARTADAVAPPFQTVKSVAEL
ncbi:MAG: protein-disulfide reductase DsbD, partial [Burkholderiaceae bacterium]